MVKRIIARYWNTVFKETPFRLIPRAMSATEDRSTAHTTMVEALHREREGDLLLHTTGTYLFTSDCLLMDIEKENHLLHKGLASSAQLIQMLESDVQKWTLSYSKEISTARRTRLANDALELKLREEAALKRAAEIKLIQAEAKIVELEAPRSKWSARRRHTLQPWGCWRTRLIHPRWMKSMNY